MRKEACPAWGKTCDICGMKNHFKNAPKCPQNTNRRVYYVEGESEEEQDCSSDEEQSFKVSKGHNGEEIYAIMETEDHKRIRFQIDSGTTTNIIPFKYVSHKVIMKTAKTLTMYNGTTIRPLGECNLVLRNIRNDRKHFCKFLVVESQLTPLLGEKSAEEMRLITVNYDAFIQEEHRPLEKITDKPHLKVSRTLQLTEVKRKRYIGRLIEEKQTTKDNNGATEHP
jgi:hypothetical protein